MAIKLNVISPVPAGVDQNLLVKAAAGIEGEGQVNLKFTDDAGIRQLNRQYAGQDYATDVLSFNYTEVPSSEFRVPSADLVKGEIVISIETASRQAGRYGTSLETEAAVLTLHGVLHILGLDHGTDGDKQRMDRLQAMAAQAVGINYRKFFSD